MNLNRFVDIKTDRIVVDGVRLETSGEGIAMLTGVYRSMIGDYPKYFKMDPLCRLGFVASELLLAGEGERFANRSDRAIVVVSRCGSVCDDEKYQATITDSGNYFPSPAVFVYTLPNIVTGEIAIRNKYNGETSCMVLDEYDAAAISRIIMSAFRDDETVEVIGGWLDCRSDNEFSARLVVAGRGVTFEELKEFFES